MFCLTLSFLMYPIYSVGLMTFECHFHKRMVGLGSLTYLIIILHLTIWNKYIDIYIIISESLVDRFVSRLVGY